MELHEHLRDLVARQGPDVVETAESFRAALDDFLAEDEATTGELNLLVDAVRLGGVHRLLSIVDHGADPAAAVREAGDAFARDRGTDDLARCRWAVAVVGYALGRVDEAVVHASGAGTPRPPAPPPVPPPAPSPEAPPTVPETEPVASVPAPPPLPPHLPPPPPSPARRRGRTLVVVPLVAAVVAGAVLAGIWLGSRDDPEQAAGDPGGEATSEDEPTGGEDTGGGGESGSGEAAIPENAIVLPITDGRGESRIYAVDADKGEPEQLTEGPDDRLPVVSPDRSTLIYLEGTPGGSTRPMVMDVGPREARPLFDEDGACAYSRRPAFDPSGDRLVVPCVDEDGDYQNTTVVDLDGNEMGGVAIAGEPLGTPTWTSESSLVYAVDGVPSTLWEIRLPGQQRDPLTDGSEGWDSHPDWSEKRGLLLFSRHVDEQVFGDLLTLDGTGQPGPGTEGELWGHPAWSPEGDRVVFTVRDDGTERLAVAPIDDLPDVSFVPDLPGEPGVPAWGSR